MWPLRSFWVVQSSRLFVYQKNIQVNRFSLTCMIFRYTKSPNDMNALTIEKKTVVVSMLCEGSSIRSIERVTGIHRDTIMRLGVRIGRACVKIMDEKRQNIPSAQIQLR